MSSNAVTSCCGCFSFDLTVPFQTREQLPNAVLVSVQSDPTAGYQNSRRTVVHRDSRGDVVYGVPCDGNHCPAQHAHCHDVKFFSSN